MLQDLTTINATELAQNNIDVSLYRILPVQLFWFIVLSNATGQIYFIFEEVLEN